MAASSPLYIDPSSRPTLFSLFPSGVAELPVDTTNYLVDEFGVFLVDELSVQLEAA